MGVLLTELHRNGDGMRLHSVSKLSGYGRQLICSQGFLTFWTRNYFFSFSTPVYKIRIIQEPNTIEL